MMTLTHGMVLAAGLGTRMRPLTDSVPKPLIPVAGRTLLDRALDRLAEARLQTIVINSHYLGGQIESHIAERQSLQAEPRLVVSPEKDLLETGGGVLNALPLLGEAPFVVANGDALWFDGPQSAIARLASFWDPSLMDALLLLFPTAGAIGYRGRGDFFMDVAGRLERRGEGHVAPFLFTGVQILSPSLFDGEAPGAFSLNRVYDKALSRDRLYGIRHDGVWYHVGTQEELAHVEAILNGTIPHEPLF